MMTLSPRTVHHFQIKDALEPLSGAFERLTPQYQLRNPVMFVIYCGALLMTLNTFIRLIDITDEPISFLLSVTIILWMTVLFANYAESYAEGRAKAQAASMKKARADIVAKRLTNISNKKDYERIPATLIKNGDIVLVEAKDFIPADGQILKGVASIDESAITGESAPVIREAGSDNDTVTADTRVLSNWIVIKVTADMGESYLDKMIAMVEGAKRQKTPNELALSVLLTTMTITFLLSCATFYPFSTFATKVHSTDQPVSLTVLISLFVCLAPTTIGGLLSAIGIAGMSRLMHSNVVATSGRAVEAAGDISVLLLDKTGTITYGNRQATGFYPAPGISTLDLVKAAVLSSYADTTPEGKSIIDLAKRAYNVMSPPPPDHITFIPFSADTRYSGVTIGDRTILKGAGDAIENNLKNAGVFLPKEANETINMISRQGGTPLLVTEGSKFLGVIQLKDVVKAGIKQRLASLRSMGIKSVMITGDNPLTAAAIAAEAGVDDFISQAIPETKLKYIRSIQDNGELVAMVGDGTNDAPALAQADVAVAMNSGTQAAKEASNMVDLDSDPTKLIEIVEIGKQLLMTRGSLTTFSLANDIAKYFAIMPVVFAGMFPSMAGFDLMHFSSPQNAILASLLFNALIIPTLIPLVMRGVAYKPVGATRLLQRNMIIYGGGGVIMPFVGIKLIDLLLTSVGA